MYINSINEIQIIPIDFNQNTTPLQHKKRAHKRWNKDKWETKFFLSEEEATNNQKGAKVNLHAK